MAVRAARAVYSVHRLRDASFDRERFPAGMTLADVTREHERIRQAERDVMAYALEPDSESVDLVQRNGVWMTPEEARK